MSASRAIPSLSFLALAGLGIAACGAPLPPTELTAARGTYAQASSGSAAALAPVEVDYARLALADAETSFRQHGPDAQTRDLAYIAERRGERAIAYGNIAVANQRRAQTLAQITQRQAAQQQHTVAELNQTREQLAAEQARVAQGQQALGIEHAARVDAEQTAANALASLRQVASVREESRGMVITLSGEVLFAPGQSVLLPIAQQRLGQVAAALHDHAGQDIVVEGHTDSRGSVSGNSALSLARAQAVRDYLTANGVAAEHIRAEGLGSTRPVADNGTPDGRANNRRVEIVVQPRAGNSVGGGPSVAP